MPGTKNFKSLEAFKKYEAYKHIHLGPHKEGDPYEKITINGKPHKVIHGPQMEDSLFKIQ